MKALIFLEFSLVAFEKDKERKDRLESCRQVHGARCQSLMLRKSPDDISLLDDSEEVKDVFALYNLSRAKKAHKHKEIPRKSPSEGPTLKILYVGVLFLENLGEETPPPIENLGSQIFMLGTPLILYVLFLYVLFSSPNLLWTGRCGSEGKKVYTEGVLRLNLSSANSSASTGNKEVWRIPKSLFSGEKKEKHEGVLSSVKCLNGQQRGLVYTKKLVFRGKEGETYTPKSLPGVGGGPLRTVLVYSFWPPSGQGVRDCKTQEALEGDILIGDIGKWDFAVKFALDMSILTAPFKAIPQGQHHLGRKSAV